MSVVRGGEERVVAAFCGWLTDQGWLVTREVDFVDVFAERAGERLLAEARGRTASPGLDVDTVYGQLLRRMREPDQHTRYAGVVPVSALAAVQRVPNHMCDLLRIDVYAVSEAGTVSRAERVATALAVGHVRRERLAMMTPFNARALVGAVTMRM